MTTKKKITIAQHKELAHRLNDPRVIALAQLVINTTGPSSRPAKPAARLIDAIGQLRAELEIVLARDHPGINHTAIYYNRHA